MTNIRTMTVKEVQDEVDKLANQLSLGTGTSQTEKKLHIALTELQLRSQKALKESVDAFSASSEEYSQRIVFLTKVLVALTVVLLFVTLVVTVLAIPGAWRAIFN